MSKPSMRSQPISKLQANVATRFLGMKNNPICEQWSKKDWERKCPMLRHPENKISIADMVIIAGQRLTLFRY